MKALNKFQKGKHKGTMEVELPLAPMASVFTVILVFLIKSVSMSASTVSPSADVTLPELTTAGEMTDALKVEISGSSIQVGDKAVMKMKNFVPSEVEADSFKKLDQALAFEHGENKVDKDTKLVIVADKSAPYKLLKQVMASAASSGYLDLKLVVVASD